MKNKLPKAKESAIQKMIEDHLIKLERKEKIVFIKNNTGAFKTAHGAYVRFGKAGSPDFLIFLKAGQIIHLEVKSETGEQNDNQIKYQIKIEKLSHLYYIVRDLSEVEKILEKYI